MSQKRTLYILLGALLAQVALAAVLWWPPSREGDGPSSDGSSSSPDCSCTGKGS